MAKLRKIEVFDYDGYVYDITVEKNHNFIADGIFVHNCAKKRYALNVLENEGVRYAEPYLKITGLETVRSSTPKVVREALQSCIKIILQKSEADLKEFVAKFKKDYFSNKFTIEEISWPRGISDLTKYVPDSVNPRVEKGVSVPIACRAAANHNKLVRKLHLTDKYKDIQNGDKIMFVYLKKQNPIKDDVIGWVGSSPKEFQLEKYIDYKTVYSKSFEEPLKKICDAIDWCFEDVVDLESELF